MGKHLTDTEIAKYVDAIEDEKRSELSEDILVHVSDCLERKIEMMEVLEIVCLDSFNTIC